MSNKITTKKPKATKKELKRLKEIVISIYNDPEAMKQVKKLTIPA